MTKAHRPRRGRPPNPEGRGDAYRERVMVSLTPLELKAIDAARGNLSRSVYIRSMSVTEDAQWDAPDLDGTDGAHPAWWRGCDHGVSMTVRSLTRTLDGLDDGSGAYGSSEMETMRRRILAMLAANPSRAALAATEGSK